MVVRVVKVVGSLVLAATALALAALAVAPRFGYATEVVMTGSMRPTAPPGSVVLMRPTTPAAVDVGDIILIRRDRDGVTLTPVLHRVIARDDVDGQLVVRTKGDANPVADPEPYTLVGPTMRPIVIVPHLGFVFSVITTKLGWIFLVVVPASLILALTLLRTWSSDTAGIADAQPSH